MGWWSRISLPFLLALTILTPMIAAKTFYMRVNVSGNGIIIVENSTQLDESTYAAAEGVEVRLIALPREGWEFLMWLSEDPNINASKSRELTIRMASNLSLTAIFFRRAIEPEFVLLRVSSNVPVKIDYPEVALKGRRVTITAPEVSLVEGRDDLRYVFEKWIVDGREVYTYSISIEPEGDMVLKAVYRTEFRFMGEWFPIENGVAVKRVEIERETGVLLVVECYRITRLNSTICPQSGRESYIPANLYGELEPIYSRMVMVELRVEGIEEVFEAQINGRTVLISPVPYRTYVREHTIVSISIPERVGDYVLEDGAPIGHINASTPLYIVLRYRFDPLSAFIPPLKPLGSLLLMIPFLGDAIASLQRPIPSVIAASIMVAPAALVVYKIVKVLRKRTSKEVFGVSAEHLTEAAAKESPRQTAYVKQLLELVRPTEEEKSLIVKVKTQTVKNPEGPRPSKVVVGRARKTNFLRVLKERPESATVAYDEFVEVVKNRPITQDELEYAISSIYIEGGPRYRPIQLPDDDVVVIFGDGRSSSFENLGIPFMDPWSVPKDLKHLLAQRKGERLVVVRCADLMEEQEAIQLASLATDYAARLVLLYDSPEVPTPFTTLNLSPPDENELLGVLLAEAVMKGSRLKLEDAKEFVAKAVKVHGLQYALARAFGAAPEDVLKALPWYTTKYGQALTVLKGDVRFLARRIEETAKAYGELGLLKYSQVVARRLETLVRMIE